MVRGLEGRLGSRGRRQTLLHMPREGRSGLPEDHRGWQRQKCVFTGPSRKAGLAAPSPGPDAREAGACPGISPGPLDPRWGGEAEGAGQAEGRAGEELERKKGLVHWARSWCRGPALRWGALLEVYLFTTGRQVCRWSVSIFLSPGAALLGSVRGNDKYWAFVH